MERGKKREITGKGGQWKGGKGKERIHLAGQ